VRLDFDEIDRFLIQQAFDSGKPIPEVKLTPRLQALVDTIEKEYGCRVLPRPHRFLGLSDGFFSPEENTVAVFIHPEMPEDRSVMVLLHESGHLEQERRGIIRDRRDISNFLEHEREADQLGRENALRWGEGRAFPQKELEKRSEFYELPDEILFTFSDLTGIKNAIVLASLVRRLVYGLDPFISQSLKDANQNKPLTYEKLLELACKKPELFAGFSRSSLHKIWNITKYGNEAHFEIQNPTEVASALAWMISGKRVDQDSINPAVRVRWVDGREIYALWIDITYLSNVCDYILLTQNAVLAMETFEPLAVTWEFAKNPEGSLYLMHLRSSDESLPEFKIYARFDESFTLDDNNFNEDVLRAYIQTYQDVSGVYQKNMNEMLKSIAHLWGRTESKIPAEWMDKLVGENG